MIPLFVAAAMVKVLSNVANELILTFYYSFIEYDPYD
jgi:hypothetical protein